MGTLTRLAVCLGAAALFAGCGGPQPRSVGYASVARGTLWQCDGRLLPDVNISSQDAGGKQEAISYLYVGAPGLKDDYGATATFTLPRKNLRHGWYANSVVLKVMGDDRIFVSLMLIRNKRFDFAQHIAVAWATPGAADVSYRDTNLVYPDPGNSHRLGIGVKRNVLSLYVDGHTVCTTHTDRFVRPNAIKWFQVRTETNVPGQASSGTVRFIALKRDADSALTPFSIHCEWHGSGLSWTSEGAGSFRTSGAFRPNEKTYTDGAKPGAKCSGVVRPGASGAPQSHPAARR